MQVSKKGVNKKISKKIFSSLYQVLADMRKKEEVEKFLDDVLSKVEKTVLAKRLAIASYLTKGKSYEVIRDDLKVSSATIASVQKWLEQGGEGLAFALKRVEADEWAEAMANKISESFKKVLRK
jgi:TrpR-related protein YerC/YecD